jgi:hypothetical protein
MIVVLKKDVFGNRLMHPHRLAYKKSTFNQVINDAWQLLETLGQITSA